MDLNRRAWQSVGNSWSSSSLQTGSSAGRPPANWYYTYEAKDGTMYSHGIEQRKAKREAMQHAKPSTEKVLVDGQEHAGESIQQTYPLLRVGTSLRKDNNLINSY